MILSQTAEYALRVMTSIALTKGGLPVRAKDISADIGCAGPYLSKVLRKLVTAGLLKASKGHGGGFLLAKPPEKILFSQILAAVKEKAELKHCIFGWRQCNAKKPCILHHRWSKVSSSFENWTRSTSLANIQRDAEKSQWLLSVREFSTPNKIRKKEKHS